MFLRFRHKANQCGLLSKVFLTLRFLAVLRLKSLLLQVLMFLGIACTAWTTGNTTRILMFLKPPIALFVLFCEARYRGTVGGGLFSPSPEFRFYGGEVLAETNGVVVLLSLR